ALRVGVADTNPKRQRGARAGEGAEAAAPPPVLAPGMPLWMVVRPQELAAGSPETRAAELVRRMIAARKGGADVVFAADVFHRERGLITADGSPTPLFPAWRTTALALADARYVGSLELPSGSENAVFVRGEEAVLIAWNERPTTEALYLGPADRVGQCNLWGQRRPAATRQTGDRVVQWLELGPSPVLFTGCSAAIARWGMDVGFERGRLPSATGEHAERIVGRNTFPQGVSGEVTVHGPAEWGIEPSRQKFTVAAGEPFELPFVLTLPLNATLGRQVVELEFALDAERAHRFRVRRAIEIGLGDVLIEVTDRRRDDGTLEIEQVLINNTEPEEILDFECSLFVPGQKRQKTVVTRLGRGRNRKVYAVPDADALQGRELWIRVEQVGGRRVLNKRWTTGTP
ncbi:MAG: sporulation protein, partial [Planctomycetes bacterium]|nr:sporulation protein [Planctomycetota bacterium]